MGLRDPRDLFRNLESEYEQLITNSGNDDVACNFLVTAWYLLEWVYPDYPGDQKALAKMRAKF